VWLHFLKVVDPAYHDVKIDKGFDAEAITRELLDGVHIADSRLIASMESFAAGPIATEEGVEHVLVTPTIADVESYDALRSVMVAVKKACKTTQSKEKAEENFVKVPRGSYPVNEFENNQLIMKGGFPHLFAIFDFKRCGVRSGTLPQQLIKHWLSLADGRFAKEPQFAFLCFNQLQRHSLTQQVARTVRSGKGEASILEFKKLIMEEGFNPKLDKAIANPTDPESVKLQKIIIRHVQTFSSQVLFLAMERKSCLQKIYSLFFYGGYPSIFWTLSPADMDMPHTLRLALRATTAPEEDLASIPLPQDFIERFEIAKANPCFAAETFDRLITAVLEEGRRVY